MTPLQSPAGIPAVNPIVDAGLQQAFQDLQGLALRTEQLAAEVTTAATLAAQRAEEDAKKLRALASQLRSSAERTGISIAEVSTSTGNSVAALGIQEIVAAGPQVRWVVKNLTEQERPLFERRMTKRAHEIAGLIGMPATVLLIDKCGGSTVCLEGRDLAFISAILGVEAVAKLKERMGRNPFSVPICEAAKRAVIHSRIRAEYDRMTTVEKLSSRKAVRNLMHFVFPSLTDRGVRRILSESDDLAMPTPAKSSTVSPHPWKKKG